MARTLGFILSIPSGVRGDNQVRLQIYRAYLATLENRWKGLGGRGC